MRHHLTAITAALVIAFATTACTSAPPAKRDLTIAIGGSAMTAQEEADAVILDAATNAFNTGGYAAMKPHLPKMKEALDHAPAAYGAIERQDDGSYIVRTDDMTDGVLLSVAAATFAEQKGDTGSVITSRNVYPMIAMMLGSDAVERQAFAEAHVYLDKGLALQPSAWFLLSEKAAAYGGQQEWLKMKRLTDAALRNDDVVLVLHRDAILKKHGFALIELGYLDDAQTAYEEVLENTPDDETAKRELAYIADLRKGMSPTQPELIAPGATGQQ